MELTDMQLEQLETPCLIVDVEKVRRNIEQMQAEICAAGCSLRPHVKTHKMPYFARMQMEAGACGITCAKVSEAEVMADGGLDDIFIAYPMVGLFRIQRAVRLSKKIRRLILAVDSAEGAGLLNEEARKAGARLEIRLEIDTGAGRTGIAIEQAAQLALAVSRMEWLNLTGIYTFKGLIYKGKTTDDNALAAREEGDLLEMAARAIMDAGVEIKEISGGSSPTGLEAARTGKMTEVRPGTYLFKDQLLCGEHVAVPEEVAVKFVATVVSTPCEEYAVIDGGSKTFPSDIMLYTPPFCFLGYASVEDRPDLCLARMNEEHGIISSSSGKTGLKVGDRLMLVPIHVCTAINMHNEVYLMEGGNIRRQKVDARGMVV